MGELVTKSILLETFYKVDNSNWSYDHHTKKNIDKLFPSYYLQCCTEKNKVFIEKNIFNKNTKRYFN